MRIDETTIRILVRKDYKKCYDFYTEILGLIPFWGDENGPYTSFSTSEGNPPCLAIFEGKAMDLFEGYIQPKENTQPDTIVAVIPSDNLDKDYQRLKEAGVNLLGEPQFINEWEMRCFYFRDIEGNLFEINDASSL